MIKRISHRCISQETCHGLIIRKYGSGKTTHWLILSPEGRRIDSALTRAVAMRRVRRIVGAEEK